MVGGLLHGSRKIPQGLGKSDSLPATHPVLLFLGVFVSLVFFLLRNSLVFLSVSAYLSGFLKGSHGERNPWCF